MPDGGDSCGCAAHQLPHRVALSVRERRRGQRAAQQRTRRGRVECCTHAGDLNEDARGSRVLGAVLPGRLNRDVQAQLLVLLCLDLSLPLCRGCGGRLLRQQGLTLQAGLLRVLLLLPLRLGEIFSRLFQHTAPGVAERREKWGVSPSLPRPRRQQRTHLVLAGLRELAAAAAPLSTLSRSCMSADSSSAAAVGHQQREPALDRPARRTILRLAGRRRRRRCGRARGLIRLIDYNFIVSFCS